MYIIQGSNKTEYVYACVMPLNSSNVKSRILLYSPSFSKNCWHIYILGTSTINVGGWLFHDISVSMPST